MKWAIRFIVLLVTASLGFFVGTQIDNEKKYDVYYETGIYENKNWEEEALTYDEDVVPNKEVAIEVAFSIFKNIKRPDYLQNAVPQDVFFDEEDEIWIVSFWEDTEELICGGDCSIALNKSNGMVRSIWFGE